VWTVTTFVLVPGAGGSLWYWHRIAPLLEAAGHTAVPVDLPGDDEGAGLPEYARLVGAAVERAAADPDGVVLVGQSLGGFSVSLVAASGVHRGVRALVLVNAMIPVPGETAGAWWEHVGQDAARVAAAERGGWSTEFDVATYFLHDVPPEVAAAGESHERPEAEAVFTSPCDFTDWPDLPIHVVTGADDRFFPVGLQTRLARERLGVEPHVLPGGHLIALSHPDELASHLLTL
jgi:pimeloyl-ACP methyl ester carboxylesterase